MLSKTEITFDKLAKKTTEKETILAGLVLADDHRNVIEYINLDNWE